MKRLRRRMGVAAAALVVGVLAVAPSFGQGVQPRVETFDNGLELIMVERHEQPTVACGMFFDVGSIDDPRGQSGIAHLFEHMLFKGTRTVGTTNYEAERTFLAQQDELRSQMDVEMDHMRLRKRHGQMTDVLDPEQWTPKYAEMKKRYDGLIEAQREYIVNNELANLYSSNGGAMLNAGTAEDITMYFVQLPSNKLELFMWLESDRMVNGVMREFYVERDNVREERRLRTESTPTGKFDEAFEALFWQAHPYGIPVLGWASEVESITRADCLEFYKKFYAPNRCRMVLVGDFDPDKTIEMAKRYFGSLPASTFPRPLVVTEEPKPIAERRFYAEAETNPRVRIRFRGVAMGHSDEAALDMVSQLLSGKTGRLYKRLVTDEDVSSGQPFAGNEARKYAGHFEITAIVKDGSTPERVEKLLLEELAKLAEGEISDREIQKVKNQVLAGSVRRLKSNFGLMFQLGMFDTWFDWSYINESPKRMLAVTADDVRRVIAEYLDPTTRTVAIYTTKAGTKSDVDPELAQLLADMPEESHEMIKGMAKQFTSAEDGAKLGMMLQRMEQSLNSEQMPEEQKPMAEYMVKLIKARIAELEAKGDKESN